MKFEYPKGVRLNEKISGRDTSGKRVKVDRYQPTEGQGPGVLFDMLERKLIKPLQQNRPVASEASSWRDDYFERPRRFQVMHSDKPAHG
jgi:hypothetical protein